MVSWTIHFVHCGSLLSYIIIDWNDAFTPQLLLGLSSSLSPVSPSLWEGAGKKAWYPNLAVHKPAGTDRITEGRGGHLNTKRRKITWTQRPSIQA